ncbi:MAG: GYF domain-containing protein [Gemmataceae bacterium]|nr:GYF domain-containing protein [Gemmataceae bacterium]
MIYFSCPGCQKLAQASEAMVGAIVTCPDCGQAMTVPAVVSSTATPPTPAVQFSPPGTAKARVVEPTDGKMRFVCPTCGKRLRVFPNAVGAMTSCKRCGQRMLVPSPGPDAPNAATEPPPIPPVAELPRMPSQYYYVKGNQRHGPVFSPELKRLADAGQLLPTDLIWKTGMPRWTPAAKLRNLFPRTSVPLPTPKPPPLPTDLPTPAGPPPLPATPSPLAGRGAAVQRPAEPAALTAPPSAARPVAPRPAATPPPSGAKSVGQRPGEAPVGAPSAIPQGSEVDRAIATATDVLRRNPRNVAALINRGMAYAEKSDTARALADLAEAVRYDPSNAQAYASRGVIHATLKRDYALGIADLTRAIQCAPEEIVLYEFRALFYRTIGDMGHAAEDERRVIDLRPRATASNLNFGRMPPASLVAPLGKNDRATS